MRITFVSPKPNISGGCRVIATYANHLHDMGHDVVVIAPKPRELYLRSRLKAFVLRRNTGRTKGLLGHYAGMKARLQFFTHDGGVTDEDVPDGDVVIATWWRTAEPVARLSLSKGRKYYFVQHHEVVFTGKETSKVEDSYRLPLRKITIASWLSETMRDRYNDANSRLVPNSVDPSLFHAVRRGRQAIPTVGILYSGKSFKGFDVSSEAITIARRTYPGLQVVAFGAEEISIPLPGNTQFFHRPAQEKLRDIYSMCDLFICGSRLEGFGLPILEAMACRCPVVATRTGCAPDVIKNGVNGYIVDIDDPTAMADRICGILSLEQNDWQKMSDAALEATTQYSWAEAAKRFEKALMEP